MTTEAGREMDAECALKIMGYERTNTPNEWPDQWKMPSRNPDPKHREAYPYWYKEFQPSTQIEDAWLVAEKVGGLWGVGYGPARKEYAAYFQTAFNLPTARGYADTAPLALCRAALEAKRLEGK